MVLVVKNPPTNARKCRMKWQLIPVFLSGKSHGPRNLVGYSPWSHRGLDTPEHICIHSFLSPKGESQKEKIPFFPWTSSYQDVMPRASQPSSHQAVLKLTLRMVEQRFEVTLVSGDISGLWIHDCVLPVVFIEDDIFLSCLSQFHGSS